MISSTPRSTALAPSALHALTKGLIDYAGLFPPAGLPLDEALTHYARYRTEAEAWMLSRFIIPVHQLPALTSYSTLFTEGLPFRFSVLGTGGPTAEAFVQSFAEDLEAIRTFHEHHPGRVQVESMEVRLPPPLHGASPDVVYAFLSAVGERRTARLPDLELYLEVPITNGLRKIAPGLLGAIATYNDEHGTRVGFKMRTGGLEPAAFPTPEALAYAIVACVRARVPFKATAGLHHPVRLYHESVQTHMYGFFNLFGAAVLAAAHNLDVATVRTLLLDEDPTHFTFTPNAFTWTTYAASPAAIRHTRTTLARSYGSCSFDEPREDLQALGLL